MGSGGGDTETTNIPWAGLQPFLERGFGEAQQNVLDRPLEFFPNSTVTPFAPETSAALGATTGRAMTGSALNPAAQGQVMDTLGGNFLTGGAGHDAMLDAVISGVAPQVGSQFGLSGRGGDSPLANEALGRGVGRGMAPFYSAERDRMMGASALAPQLAREDYYDIDRLGGVGARREDLFGRQLGDQMARWGFEQGEPGARIGQFMSLLQGGGSPFGSSTTSGGGKGAGGTALGGLGAATSIAGLGGPGGFGWWPAAGAAAASSRAFKEDAQPAESVLPGVERLSIEQWRYREEMGLGNKRHLGPYAEEFKEIFGVGDGVTIHLVDALGVCLKAIQELGAKVVRLEEKV